MAMIYRQVVTGAMASGATIVVPHTLGTVPHYISPNCVTSVAVVGATASTVTFRNDGPATDSVTFMLEAPESDTDDDPRAGGHSWYGGFLPSALPFSGTPAVGDLLVSTSSGWARLAAPSTGKTLVGAGTGVAPAFASPQIPGDYRADVDSLINGDIGDGSWNTYGGGGTINCSPNRYPDLDGGNSLTQFNATRDATILYRTQAINFPVGITKARAKVVVRRMANAGWAGITFVLRVLKSDGGTTVTALTIDPTTASTEYQTAEFDVDVTNFGAERWGLVRFETSAANVCCFIGRVRIVPTAGTHPILNTPGFLRYPMTQRTVWSSVRRVASSTYWQLGSGARLIIDTDAEQILVEAVTTMGNTPFGNVVVWVNGKPFASIEATKTSGYPGTYTVTLPTSMVGQVKRVEVHTGALSDNAGTIQGTWPTAVYIPSGYSSRLVLPVDRPRRVLLVGDSILSGYGTIHGAMDSPISILRERVSDCEIYADVYSGGAIFRIAGDANKRTATMARWTKIRPTHVIIELGTNDYAGPYSTVADFTTAYDALLDLCIAAWPGVQIQLVTPLLHPVGEGANALGETLDQFRAAITALAAALSLPTALDGKTAVVAADLMDGAHPGNSDVGGTPEAGIQKVVALLASVLE